MASANTFAVNAPVLAGCSRARGPRLHVASRPVRTGAATDKDQKTEDPKFSFSVNDRSALGYLKEDSAGQENIFPIQPAQYVEGSVRDVNTDASANTAIATGGAALGLVAVALGVVALLNLGDGSVANSGSATVPLSQYSAKFSAELERSDI